MCAEVEPSHTVGDLVTALAGTLPLPAAPRHCHLYRPDGTVISEELTIVDSDLVSGAEVLLGDSAPAVASPDDERTANVILDVVHVGDEEAAATGGPRPRTRVLGPGEHL